MFSFLVALTMLLTFSPAPSAATETAALDVRPVMRSSLPLAAKVAPPSGPVKKDPARLGVRTTSRAAFVADWKTGQVLFEKNADAPQSIASISKLVTALAVLETGPDWDAEVELRVSDGTFVGVPYLTAGERVTVADLFNMSLVGSSNGATVALARSTGLSPEEFAAKMNDVAASLGMTDAAFVEPTGLDSGNMASARDVSRLIRHALDQEDIRKSVMRKDYRFTAKTGLSHAVLSTDELLGSFLDKPPYEFLGGKTGFIDEAGYCFGAAAHNADGDGVVAVVLGADTKELRFKEVKSLMYWAFDAYAWPERALTDRR